MKNKILIYSLSIASLILSSAGAYYLAVALPKIQIEKQKLEEQRFELQKAESLKENLNQEHYSSCSDEAKDRATNLLKTKIEIAAKSGTNIPSTWKEASNKGLFLKDDYESYYSQCIQRYGLK